MRYVFIHGAGCTGAIWKNQIAALPGSIAITLPGHTTPGAPASIAEFADAVAGELDARGIDDAVLCGHSMGGAIALELALRGNSRVRAIVMLASGAKLRVAPSIIEGLETDFPAATRTLASYFFVAPTPEMLENASTMAIANGAEQTIRDFRACDAFNATDRLGEVAVPALALVGDSDVMTPPKFSQFLADRIPGASARILSETGHFAMIERPDETNEALRAFISKIAS